jgi:cell division protein FtsN
MKKKDTASSNRKKTSGGLMPKSTAGWLFLLFFISAWMFFLGVLVGRGTVPVKFDINKLQKELATLKATDLKEQIKRVKIHSDATKMKSGLGFYEELKDTKDHTKSDRNPNVDLTTRTEKPLAKDSVSKTKKKPSREKSQDSGNNRTDTIADLSKIPTTGKKMTIQAASFRASEDADQMVSKLKKKGYPAYKIIGVVPEKGVWYRVRIGYYGSKAEAVGNLKKLKQDGYNAILVNR